MEKDFIFTCGPESAELGGLKCSPYYDTEEEYYIHLSHYDAPTGAHLAILVRGFDNASYHIIRMPGCEVIAEGSVPYTGRREALYFGVAKAIQWQERHNDDSPIYVPTTDVFYHIAYPGKMKKWETMRDIRCSDKLAVARCFFALHLRKEHKLCYGSGLFFDNLEEALKQQIQLLYD